MLWCSLGCEDERGDYGADGVVQEVHELLESVHVVVVVVLPYNERRRGKG